MSEFQEYVAGLGKLVGNKITGVAYSELNGAPVVVFNLIDEKGELLTSHYTPIDAKAFDKKPENKA